ncbi:MAG: hypothetical protein WDN44_07430 [Sphingomonas sp.]
MAGEQVYVAKLGGWIARALGRGGAFAGDLNTDGLGFQLPPEIVDDPAVKAAGAAVVEAADRLTAASDELFAAAQSAASPDLFRGFVDLAEGLYRFVDATADLVDRIEARGASLPGGQSAAVAAFAGVMARKVFDFLVITLLQQELPRTAFLLELFGIIDKRVVPEDAAAGVPLHARMDLRLDRIKTLVTDPAAHFADVYGWGTPAFEPYPIMRAIGAFYSEETAIDVGHDGADAFLRFGPYLWARDGSVAPPGLKFDYGAKASQHFAERFEINDQWGLGFDADLTIEGGGWRCARARRCRFRSRPRPAISAAISSSAPIAIRMLATSRSSAATTSSGSPPRMSPPARGW